jgi:hypothetical protein
MEFDSVIPELAGYPPNVLGLKYIGTTAAHFSSFRESRFLFEFLGVLSREFTGENTTGFQVFPRKKVS